MENVIFSIFTTTFQNTVPTLAKEFAVRIDDRGDLYLKSLTAIMKKFININNKVVKNIEFGDYILFTKADVLHEDNYYKVIKSGIKILSLTSEYSNVEKHVVNYFKNVYSPKKEVTISLCDFCPFADLCSKPEPKKAEDIIYDGDFVNVSEKVSIFYNFVKVGYDQYDIYDLFGSKYVNIEGDLLEIKSDRYGKKYLKLVK
jgi:hypothetical protein